MGFSYSDLMMMTVFERKYFIGLRRRRAEVEEERAEKGGKSSSGGKTTISGEALKQSISNNEIRGL